jgi:type II secretory pathway predicted ATPase ExeA
MNRSLLPLYGLKWNPFSPEVPTEALVVSPRLEHFGWRLEHLVREGGFALITGDPGTGKSAALRVVAARLAGLRDVVVGVIEHPPVSGHPIIPTCGHRKVPTSPLGGEESSDARTDRAGAEVLPPGGLGR